MTDTATLSTRSLVLSLLLGARPPRLPVGELVALGRDLDVAPATMRVALSRMVASGDLVNHDAVYGLAPQHLERRAAQDAALDPVTRPYDGTWLMLVVTATGRDAATRAATRTAMQARRAAELREGVWTRPDTLVLPDPVDPDLEVLRARPGDDLALARRLWDLPAWEQRARALLAASRVDAAPRARFATAAATVRHLRTDPLLPSGLLPPDWPAAQLRAAYETFRHDLSTRRQDPP